MNGMEVNQGFTNAWSGTHAGNQGRAKRLCHMEKRWERQIGTKRQPDLRELLSEVDVRGFCMWSLPAAWGYSQLLLSLHPDSDLSRSWVAAAEQCLCLQSNEEIPEENISCLISIQPGGHCPRTASPSWVGGCQLPFSPTNTTSEQACPFKNNSPAAALTTTMPSFRHTTKRRSGRAGVTSSWRGSVRMGLYHPYGCFTGHFYLTFCHYYNKRL